MTAIKHYTLLCNVPGCREEFGIRRDNAGATRQAAADAGWVSIIARFGKTGMIELGPNPEACPGRTTGNRAMELCPTHAHRLGSIPPLYNPRSKA